MSSDPRGSLWNKWDLHVHTPSSIVQDYGGDNDATWEKFFTDIESLPKKAFKKAFKNARAHQNRYKY